MLETIRHQYRGGHFLNWPFIILINLALLGLTSCGGGADQSSPFEGEAKDTSFSQQSTIPKYAIGSSWDALKVNSKILLERNDFLTAKVATNTVKVSTLFQTGTGFYLGKYLDHHIIATTGHGLKNIPSCALSPVIVKFPLSDKVFTCEKLIGIWADIDFALMALRVTPSQQDFFKQLNPLKLAPMASKASQGKPLITMGFGQVANEKQELTLKEDRFCTNLSPIQKRIDNGDERMPRKIPSFAVGCDLSPGDSGSPLVDKEDGRVLGVVWSIIMPKSSLVKNNAFIENILSQQDPLVWQDFGYGVPVTAIRKSLQRWANRVEVSLPMRKRRRIVLEILN